jgi:Gpi18-like mannosyltransferase
MTLAITILSAWFTKNIWMVGDTKLFFRMAEVIANGGVPYVDFADPKPPLIFFTLAALGQKLNGGLLLVGATNFISALVIMRMAHRLYGRVPGFLAGLVFLANMALAEGFFILTEPFTTLFILLCAYALLFMDKKYVLSGVFAGIAIGFKQYALLLIPLALFYMYRNKELKGAVPFLAGVLAPLLAIYGAIGLAYGPAALQSSLYWSFGVADEYFTQGRIGDVPAYMAPSIGVALANVFLECGLFTSLLLLALAGVLSGRRLSRREEFFLLSGLAFLSLLAIRQYLHYWALALPFIVLLCVRPLGQAAHVEARSKSNARLGLHYGVAAALLFAAIIGAFLAVEYVFIGGLWRPYDILSYYGLADTASKMVLGYVDSGTPRPLLLFSIGLAADIPWNLVIVGFLSLASAIVVAAIGVHSYGLPAGLLAGLLFTSSIAWAMGYFTISEALALSLVLLSAYAFLRARSGAGYLVSGAFAGLAACFAPLALALAPISAFVAWKKRDGRHVPALLLGVALPIATAVCLAFTIYGDAVPEMAMGSGLVLAGVSIGGMPYRTPDALMAIADIALSVCLLVVPLPVALAAFASEKRRTATDGYFLLAGLGFISSLLLKEYVHYWFVALPFIALLCAGAYRQVAGNREEKVPAQPIEYNV